MSVSAGSELQRVGEHGRLGQLHLQGAIRFQTAVVRAAVLREADPEDLTIHIKEDIKKHVRVFHRITAFAYVGCHDREEFERLEKAGPENWKEHVCLRREMEKFYII